MAEAVMLALRDIAYLAGQADTIKKRQQLEMLMQQTETYTEVCFEKTSF